jgi:hypothetical protein
MIVRVLGAVLLAVVALLPAGTPLRAAQVATDVVIRPIPPLTVGVPAQATVQVLVRGGDPIADAPVELSLDGAYLRRMRTDAQGSATFSLPDLDAGDHSVSAVFPGTSATYLPAAAARAFRVDPYELVIESVPPLPGMPFQLGDERFEAGDDGFARIPVMRSGEHTLVALDGDYRDGTVTAEFSRWNTEVFWPEITITVPVTTRVQAGFDVYRPIGQTFVDLDGDPVPSSRITSIELRSSIGEIATFTDGDPHQRKVSRTVRRPNGLESVPVMYNVDAVIVDGANVVNSGQQRFYIESDEPWEIRLLLYSVRVRPRDALFGFAAGGAVELGFPNGTVERHEVADDGWVVVHGLARGIYRLSVADAPGWAPTMPVALSRDQEVSLRVISYLDMAVAAAVAAGIVFGLLHVGRPHVIPNLLRSARRALAGPRMGPEGGPSRGGAS